MQFVKASQNIQPGNDGPKTIFFTDVVGTRTKRFLSTNRQFVSIKQRTEEFPPRRHFVHIQLFVLGNEVQSTGRGHGPGQTKDSVFLEIRNEISIFGNYRNGISRRNKRSSAVDHVSVTVTIGSGTKRNIFLVDSVH